MKKRKLFLADSKQACFLCLKLGAAEDCKMLPWSITQLCRYLKLDFKKVFNISLPLLQTVESSPWEETDMMVTLCPDCYSVSTKFGKLFQELELTRLKVNASVRTIHEVMTNAVKDGRRVEEYRKLMTSNNPAELIKANIADSLRKETIQNSGLKVKTALPKVSLKRITDATSELGLSTQEMVPVFVYNDQDNSPVFQDAQDPLGNEAIPVEPSMEYIIKGCQSKFQKCTMCRKLISKKNFKKHLMTHNSKKPFSCSHCPERFIDRKKRRIHEIAKHSVKIFATCRDPSGPVTDQQFEASITRVFQQNMRTLRTASDRKGGRACNICDNSYNYKMDLEYHMVQVHFQVLATQLRELLRIHTAESESLPGTSKRTFMEVSTSLLSSFSRNEDSGGNPKVTPQITDTTQVFSCPHCDKQSKQYNHHRVHLIKNHRFEVFAKYFKSDATPVQVNFVLEHVLRQECSSLGGNKWECRNCHRKFASLATAQDHVVVSHYNEVVLELRSQLRSGNIFEEDEQPVIAYQDQSQSSQEGQAEGEGLISEEEFIIKTEVKNEVEMEELILPD